MFFRNTLNNVNSRHCRIKLPLSIDKKSIDGCGNVQTVDDKLRSFVCPEDMGISAKQVLAATSKNIYLLCDNGFYVYKIADGSLIQLSGKTCKRACSCTYQGNVIISGEGFGTYVVKGDFLSILATAGFTSLAVCGDRLFGVTGTNLYSSLAGEMNDWGNSVHITMHTECQAIAAVGNDLYVLGDTCYVLDPSAEEIDYVFKPIAYNVGNVQCDSVVVYGNKVIFATDTGLKTLTNGVVRPFTDIDTTFNSAVACFYGGKYYLSYRASSNDAQNSIQNDFTVVLSPDDGQISAVVNLGADSICVGDGVIYATSDGKLLVAGDEEKLTCFSLRNIDFGNSYVKYLDTMLIKTYSDVDVIIQSEYGATCYSVSGSSRAQTLRLSGYGRSFAVELQSEGSMAVDSVELTAHFTEED